MNTLTVHYEPAPLWTKVNALPSLFQAQQWGRCAIIDTFSPLCSSRFHAIDEGVIDRLRTIGLDDDGAYALRHNFGAGDFATHRRSCEWAIKYGGALGVMTLPLTDPGDGANGCPFVGNMYGWNPAMAVLDLDLVDEESVRLMNERGRQLQKETSGDQYEHSFNADALRAFKVKMLEKEYVRVCNSADHPDRDEVEAYIEHPPEKILDYAVTSVLSERFRCAWQSWPEEYKCKKAFEIIEFDASLYEAVKPLLYAQWKLENQVRDYCSAVLRVGGYPIIVRPFSCSPRQSAVRLDWLRQNEGDEGAFMLNRDGTPMYTAGVNTALHGTPEKYGAQRWDAAAYSSSEDAVAFVVDSIRPIVEASGGKAGVVLDHWLGLFWERCHFRCADSNDEGEYVKAWGNQLIDAIRSEYPDVVIFGEDVGFDSPQVTTIRREVGTPGVANPDFGFSEHASIDWGHILVERIPPDKLLMATGDHNSPPVREILRSLPVDQFHEYVRETLGMNDVEQDGGNFDIWWYLRYFAKSVYHAIVTVTSRDIEGTSEPYNVPGVPASDENRLWQLTDSRTPNEELADFEQLHTLLRTSRRLCHKILGTSFLPLVLSMNRKPGEVVRVKAGENLSVQLGCSSVPPDSITVTFESTMPGHLETGDLQCSIHEQDGMVVLSTHVCIPEHTPPGRYELWGSVHDGGEEYHLCEMDKNILVDVVP